MRILLDTNVLLFSFDHTTRLSRAAIADIEHAENEVFYSAVSIWEIAIKYALRKPGFDNRPDRMMQMASEIGYAELPVTSTVAATVADLPLHHRDPFDRLLIAQAKTAPARLFTSDRRLLRYSDLVDLVA